MHKYYRSNTLIGILNYILGGMPILVERLPKQGEWTDWSTVTDDGFNLRTPQLIVNTLGWVPDFKPYDPTSKTGTKFDAKLSTTTFLNYFVSNQTKNESTRVEGEH